ncbi:hypothetical protein HJFPF1_11052 [Paramyrothecium foliicola]|nr:hypothetical protein HJFPF1_11052 [Paramyrothecium foliicola]
MAHQAHNIPWNVLASNFKWRLSERCNNCATSFHRRSKTTEVKEIKYFINAFASNVRDHANEERRKYPQEYEKPEPEEIVLTGEICKKIMPTVHRWRLGLHQREFPYEGNCRFVLCPHSHTEGWNSSCKCAIPSRARTMKAFLLPYSYRGCYEFFNFVPNKDGFLNLEIFKTLLMHGETDTLLRIFSQPGHHLAQWWSAGLCECEENNLGWEHVTRYALRAYILLNFIHCFPETWQAGHDDQNDYRNTRTYQAMVHDLTRRCWNSDVAAYPHRQFFGISDDQFDENYEHDRKNNAMLRASFNGHYPLGRLPYWHFLRFEKDVGYVPLPTDASDVRSTLQKKGLPNELVEIIMSTAQYGRCTRRLAVEHDPFLPENRSELDKYLKFCWVLLVRCELMARTVGNGLNWEQLVAETIVETFRCGCRTDWSRLSHYVEGYDEPGFTIRYL